jgi:o-succinylbenzoate synthase
MFVVLFKTWFSDYKLTFKGEKKIRTGALLKIEWPKGLIGYADLCPLPEFGDAPVAEQLADLKKLKMTQQLEQSIWFANRDAKARDLKLNLMQGLPRIKNNFMFRSVKHIDSVNLAELRVLGFQNLKLKCGIDLDAETKAIEKLLMLGNFKLRLDFGAKLSADEYKKFILKIPAALRTGIEYVEDPVPFTPETWIELNLLVPLALDQEYAKVNWERIQGQSPFKVLVMKPARMDVTKAFERVNSRGLKVVMTSSLDHPVGVAHAAVLAAHYKKGYPNMMLDGGCWTHKHFEPDDFSKLIAGDGPQFPEIPGIGVGFDSAFKNLDEKNLWTPL